MSDDLKDLRDSLDNIDRALLLLLAERFRITHKVGLYKKEYNLPPVDKAREEAQLARIKKEAIANGLDPVHTQELFKSIIEQVVKNHQSLQGL